MKPFRIKGPPNYDLSELTASERLVLWRYRQRATNGRLLGRSGSSMSQSEAAACLGISPGSYARLEEGGATALSANEMSGLLAALGPLRPSLGELCLIARRRAGVTLTDMENALGVSRPWFHKLERAGDGTVVAYWCGQGYEFPSPC